MAPLSEHPLPSNDDLGCAPPAICVTPPGSASQALAARLARVECPAFGHRRDQRAQLGGVAMAPIVLASGKGSNLIDVDGNRYVDLAAGFGSLLLGHGASSFRQALDAQSERMAQALGDLYAADRKVELLERLAAIHPGAPAQVLLGQTGSDAITAAIKTALLATGRPGLVAFTGGYHGLGHAPLAACGYRDSYRAPFAAQLNPAVTFAPYPQSEAELDLALTSVERALARGDAGAVLVEPVLGRGGCIVPPDAFLPTLVELAHRRGALVIADEIWTGLGRAGSMLRSSAVGAPVDILCLGKGLGGGLAISACIAPEAIMAAWARGGEVVHTSTHSGAPLACATALATLDALQARQLPERARDVGQRALSALSRELEAAPGFVEVRGVGLMLGIELASGELGQRATRGLLERGYLVTSGGAHGETIVLTPALDIAENLLTSVGGALRAVLEGEPTLAPPRSAHG
jgi:4-aminobutyrate aminotransferase/(S)-3-amino-2-methylpropionate transaminase